MKQTRILLHPLIQGLEESKTNENTRCLLPEAPGKPQRHFFCVRCPVYCFLFWCPVSFFWCAISCFLFLVSCFWCPVSWFLVLASCFRFPVFGLWGLGFHAGPPWNKEYLDNASFPGAPGAPQNGPERQLSRMWRPKLGQVRRPSMDSTCHKSVSFL